MSPFFNHFLHEWTFRRSSWQAKSQDTSAGKTRSSLFRLRPASWSHGTEKYPLAIKLNSQANRPFSGHGLLPLGQLQLTKQLVYPPFLEFRWVSCFLFLLYISNRERARQAGQGEWRSWKPATRPLQSWQTALHLPMGQGVGTRTLTEMGWYWNGVVFPTLHVVFLKDTGRIFSCEIQMSRPCCGFENHSVPSAWQRLSAEGSELYCLLVDNPTVREKDDIGKQGA